MTASILLLLRLPLAALALFITPHLLAAACKPRHRAEDLLPLTGALSVAINAGVILLLHLSGVRLTFLALAGAHACLLAAALLLVTRRGRRGGAPDLRLAWTTADPACAVAFGLFALLVFPLTDLAGIDTYKWQDAATAVGVEGRIPWLIGPTALFGFSPRALPGAQPLLLASAQILGGLGVNAGYYAVSLLCGATGLGCARRLGLRLFDERRHALLFAVLYVFSPVFLRYAHWATGRGFCLAFLPLLLALLTEWPRGRALAGAAACGVLLAFTHKAGAVAAVVLPALYVCSLALPARPLLIRSLLCLACASATCFAPRLILPSAAGHALGAARFALTRFGCLWPLAVGAGLVIPRIFARTRWHGLSLPFLVLLPLAAHREMYPSLLFLPLVCAVATTAVAALETLAGRHARRVLPAVLTATAAFALATVAQRSLHAAPRDVRIAAGILEAYDPLGPYEVVAPGLRRRQQIQAYVSGFARFSIVPADGRVTLNRALPSLRGDPATVVLEWIDWLRHVLAVEDVETHWYGESPRRYYVRVGGEGECPASAVLVAAKAGVEVFRDVASPPPPGVNP